MTGKMLVLGLLSCGMTMAQAAPAPAAAGKPMAFDVVSIRQNLAGPGPGLPQFGPTADGYQAVNAPMILLAVYVQAPSRTAAVPKRVPSFQLWRSAALAGIANRNMAPRIEANGV